jgi:ribosomal-protein-serine acetyltransferase
MFHLAIDSSIELGLLEARHDSLLCTLVDRNREYLRRWLPWLDNSTTVSDSRAFIDQTRERYVNREGLDAGIWYRHELVGLVSLNEITWAHRKAEIGYWLSSNCQSRGIMTRSCAALIGHAFGEFDLNRVEIRCSPRNDRSRAIPARLGFTREGVIRQAEWLYDHFEDHEIYGLLAGEWPLQEER